MEDSKSIKNIKYESLPNAKSIRLLTPTGLQSIEVSNIDDEEPHSEEVPSFSLETRELAEASTSTDSFTALSYCWNHPRFVRFKVPKVSVVLCDGASVEVKPNLFNALMALSKTNSCSALWVDSICINQDDIDERNQQVSLMGRIYASAKQVLVWLGDSDVVSDLWAHLKHNASSEKLVRAEASGPSNVQAGLTYMRYCGWFDRAWTFQEAVLAGSCIAQSGSQQIDWDLLLPQWQAVGYYQDINNTGRHLRFIDSTKKENQGRLLPLLLAVWTRRASDARDKVFSVLGLYHGGPDLKPDYRLPTREVMVTASKACVLQDQNLDILHFAGRDNLRGDPHWGPNSHPSDPDASTYALLDEKTMVGNWHVPSWVPDWGSVPGNYLGAATKPVHQWPKLELGSISDEMRFNVQWDGESLIARGIALGRLHNVDNSDLSYQLAMFPKCMHVVTLADAVSGKLGPPSVVDLSQFCMKLRLHDQELCPCSREDRELPHPMSHSRDFLSLGFPNDWLCLPFGASHLVVMRPDCRIPTTTTSHRTYSTNEDRIAERNEPWETYINDIPSDQFTVVECLGEGRYTELQQTFSRLATGDAYSVHLARGMSCVLADFILR